MARVYPKSVDVLEAIIVTGSRIEHRVFASPNPIITVDRKTIGFSGQPTPEKFLNQICQVVPHFGRTSNNPGDGISRNYLRELGAGRTLGLQNPRRIAPSGVGSAVDLNNLPEALIKGVEIFTGGATTVNGPDAVAGVVNFITRDDFNKLRNLLWVDNRNWPPKSPWFRLLVLNGD